MACTRGMAARRLKSPANRAPRRTRHISRKAAASRARGGRTRSNPGGGDRASKTPDRGDRAPVNGTHDHGPPEQDPAVQQEPEKPKLGFMSLPPELRLAIYEQLLITDKTIIIGPRRYPASGKKSSKTKKNTWCSGTAIRFGVHLDILRCNKLIQHEAAHVLYSRNAFKIPRLFDGSSVVPSRSNKAWLYLVQWLEMIGPRNRRILADLHIGHSKECISVDEPLLRKAMRLLGKDKDRRCTLTVQIADYIPGVPFYPGIFPAPTIMASMMFPRMLERVRRGSGKSQGIEIFWRATVRRNNVPGKWENLATRIAEQGWEIVEYESCEKPREKYHLMTYKLRMISWRELVNLY